MDNSELSYLGLGYWDIGYFRIELFRTGVLDNSELIYS